MNDRSGAGRDARRRSRFWLDVLCAIVIVSVAFAAAACGSSPSSPGSSSSPPTLQTMTSRGLAYAQCMRSHGIQNYPDPTVVNNAHQKGIMNNVSAAIRNLPGYSSAAKTCQEKTHFGQAPSPAMLQAMMANAVKFSECMRSHGVPDYPDPVEKNGGIQLGGGPGSSSTGGVSSSRFKAANSACVSLLPGGGP